MKSSLCLPALLFAFPPQATPENLLVPATWFQEITATDGSTQHSVVFTTVPGVEYTFFHSHDLVEWTEIGKTYGLGHEFAAAMFETAPAPPPPDPENPPATPPAFTHASVSIQPSSGAAGGTVVSWASLDHGNAVSTLILGNMAAAWQTVPLFAAAHGNHHFFIIHTSGDAAPPVENPQLDDMDAAMIADLEAGWVDINTAIATATETARNTPPPPPTTDDARGFWRIKADWSLDSDNDGSPDHLEFAMAAQAPAADGLAHNAFNADTNNDGIPDGEQLDSDSDGIPDAQDIAPNDGGVAYTIVPLPRYAMFTFADTPDGSFAINDRGTVLFPGKVWKAGEFQNLLIDQRQIPGYTHPTHAAADIRARAINDSDQIIGSGTRFMPGGADPWYFDAIFHWPSPQAVPAFVSLADGGVTAHAELRDDRHVRHFDNEGNFFSPAFVWDEASGAGPPGEDAGWKKWTLAAGGAPLVAAPAAEFTKGTAPGGVIWGSKYENPLGICLESRITAPVNVEIPIEPRDVLAHGGNGNLVATTAYSEEFTQVWHDNEWSVSPLLKEALDIAADGTAIRKPPLVGLQPEMLLLNGKWTALFRALPGWLQSPITLSDTSPGGWILAHDSPGGQDDISAALLPIRLAGVPGPDLPGSLSTVEATGVDDFSIGANTPDPAAQDRLWIMVPTVAGETALHFRTPAHASAPVTITAPGITFNQSAELTLDGPSVPASIRAFGMESGEEILAEISMGELESVSQPVGFKVMKARTVRVAVYLVSLSDDNGVDSPDLIPTQTFLEDYLEKVFLRQINVDFVVTRIDHSITLDWDANGNGFLDTSAGEEPSTEQQLILDHLETLINPPDPNLPGIGPAVAPDIRVFLMGGPRRVNNNAAGNTQLQSATCWISADAANGIALETVPFTIAHEIGHVFFGEGHPDRGSGPAELPGTQHHRRLMYSTIVGGIKPGVLTVKGEWDEADLKLTVLLEGEEGQ